MNLRKDKPKRHINPEHLAVVLLCSLGIIFVLTIIIAGILPKHTVPSELTIAEATEKADADSEDKDSGTDKRALSYSVNDSTNQNSGSVTDSSSRILAFINQDLKEQLASQKIETVGKNDISITQNGDEITVRGRYTAIRDGIYDQQSFTYVLKASEDSYEVISRDINRTSSDEDSAEKTQTSTSLPSIGTYDINVTSSLHLSVTMESGEIRADVTDEQGNTKTVFDETGPYQNDDVSIDLEPGQYQLNIYGEASGWSVSYSTY